MYRLYESRLGLHAIHMDGTLVTFTAKEIEKVPAIGVASYIDARVRQAQAERKLAEIGICP